MLEIRLLGQFDVRRAGEPIAIPSRPAQSLLVYLALNAAVRCRRERIAGLLWPDSNEVNALTYLRQSLWRVRKAVGGEYIDADRVAICFGANADYWLDVSVLDQGLDAADTVDDLIDRVAVYRGDLLPGFYDDWIAPEREHLRVVFERKMRILLDRLELAQRWEDILSHGGRWVALGGAPEHAYRALMVAHAKLGDRASAVSIYRRCVDTLREDLGVQPSAETQTLYDQIISGADPLASEPTQLPQKAARHEGREKQIAVLIIEDDTFAIEGLVDGFELMGLRCFLASNVDVARELMCSRRFDLITLDMNLPPHEKGDAGYVLLDEMRRHQEGVPVIIISMLPWTGPEVRDFLREYGAFDYIRKPVRFEELLKVTRSALQG